MLTEAGQTPNQIATAVAAEDMGLLDPVKAALVLLPGDRAAQKALNLSTGVSIGIGIAYDGVLGKRSQDHAVKGSIRVTF